MCSYFDTQASPDSLRNQINFLNPVPGICIFIDMCNSTELKQRNLNDWVIMIANIFNTVNTLFNKHDVKLIGDELMIYVPDSNLLIDDYVIIFDYVRFYCLISIMRLMV